MTKAQHAVAAALVAGGAAWCGAAVVQGPPAAPRDRCLFSADRDLAWGKRERSHAARPWKQAAISKFDRAIAGFRACGRQDQVAGALSHKAGALVQLGDRLAAADALRQALALGFVVADDRLLALNRLGDLETTLGHPDAARAYLEEALSLARRTGNRPKEAAALTNLGILEHAVGHPRRARQLLSEEAIPVWEELGETREVANARNLLAEFLLDLGRPRDTVRETEKVLAAHREDSALRVRALRHRGVARLELGEAAAARDDLDEALVAARRLGHPVLEAQVRNALGYWHVEADELERAGEEFRAALRLAERSGDEPARGNALANLAHLQDLLGEEERALGLFGEARAIYEGIGDKSAVASVLSGRALAERGLGRAETALATIEEAVRLVEEVRGETGGPGFRIPFLASRMDLYDLWIEQLMERHGTEPLAGHDRRAFEVSERARARALLEALGDRETAQGLARRGTASAAGTSGDGAAFDPGGETGGASSAALRPLSLPDIQEQVLDDESALLSYHLGEERSTLWLLTRDFFRGFQLAPRAEIEALVEEAHKGLARVGARSRRSEEVLAKLGAVLLEPVGQAIEGKRLLVVPDGALHRLPFGVLPLPRSGEGARARRLLAGHAVVHLPSASLPAALRSAREGRPLAPGLVAVVAAPSPAGGIEESALPPLRFAEEEARRIAELAPGGSVLALVGAAATREQVLNGALGEVRILHFATHALIDEDAPDGSSLVLSPTGGDGRREDRVTAADLRRLDLQAELVVLSACRTAGTAFRGEGLVGLVWSLMQAGAPRVLVSLWPVDDRATAELMGYFYEGLLREGLAPPEALQRAQLRTAQRWPLPFHWAGFTLYGEWRGFPVTVEAPLPPRAGLNLPPEPGSMSERAAGARSAGGARPRQKGGADEGRPEGGGQGGGGP